MKVKTPVLVVVEVAKVPAEPAEVASPGETNAKTEDEVPVSVTFPLTVPLPAKVALLVAPVVTPTALPAAVLPVTLRVPALTVVAPV